VTVRRKFFRKTDSRHNITADANVRCYAIYRAEKGKKKKGIKSEGREKKRKEKEPSCNRPLRLFDSRLTARIAAADSPI
jgi:hypothetical protein